MAELERAKLIELNAKYDPTGDEDKTVTVQFNPESLKVSFSNNFAPANTGDQRGSPADQYLGGGRTRLSVQLWFDVTGTFAPAENAVDDVRKLTRKVVYYITPKKDGDQLKPPAVRFLWGSFQFDGLVESIEESLEMFSSDGRPLRAGVSLSLSQQKILDLAKTGASAAGAGAGGLGLGLGVSAGMGGLGTLPLVSAQAGVSLQEIVSANASFGTGAAGASWQAVASANQIENPRMLEPGQLINVNVKGSTSFGSK